MMATVAGVLVAALIVAGAIGIGGGATEGAEDAEPRYGTATVEIRTLRVTTALDGRLGRGPAATLPVRATGTVTWLPRAGARLERGDVVIRVDDRPVVLLIGAMPAYRALTKGARGRDVRQFEANLYRLGHRGFVVDERFTADTARAVSRWQRDLGVKPTGDVTFGDVVYANSPIRVRPQTSALGGPVGDESVTYTPEAKTVTVAAAADDVGWARRGARVDVTLPDGTTVAGQVASVGRDAAAASSEDAGDSPPTVPVIVSIADQKALRAFESGPVTVEYTARERKDVLAVPVTALVALAEGGHGVEPAATPDKFVAVKTGMFADGFVEITGPVRAGLAVRAPA